MEFVDASGTRYQLAEAVEAPAPAKKAPVWPWVVGGLAVAGGLLWMAASSPWKANPVSHDLETLIMEAQDPATPFERLEVLQKHSEVEVRRALLGNPNVCPTNEDGTLTTDLLWNLAQEFPEEVAAHPLFVLHALIEPDEEILGVVIEVVGRTADVGLIETLLRSWGPHSWEVRESVAWNPHTPEDMLRILGNEATESKWYVRQAVARNPNTPPEVLRLLGNEATESTWRVREAVAQNPSTPLDTLRTLGNPATESNPLVREEVAGNSNTPKDVLRFLSNDATKIVREAAEKSLSKRGLVVRQSGHGVRGRIRHKIPTR